MQLSVLPSRPSSKNINNFHAGDPLPHVQVRIAHCTQTCYSSPKNHILLFCILSLLLLTFSNQIVLLVPMSRSATYNTEQLWIPRCTRSFAAANHIAVSRWVWGHAHMRFCEAGVQKCSLLYATLVPNS